MKFVSRRVCKVNWKDNCNTVEYFGYGVVDTSTGKESFMTINDLEGATDIDGVIEEKIGDITIPVINPHQLPIEMGCAQAKFRMLTKVNVVRHGDTITDIQVPQDIAGRTVQIKLSDFGKRCADCVIGRSVQTTQGGEIIITVDDKIKCSPNAFVSIGRMDEFMCSLNHSSFKLDVRGVKSIIKSWKLVRGFCCGTMYGEWVYKNVIDSNVRKAIYGLLLSRRDSRRREGLSIGLRM